MRKLLLLCAAVVMIAAPVTAQHIGLFTDANHDTWCASGTPNPFYLVTMWIWCLPDADGQYCAEFAISYPTAGVIRTQPTPNVALISVQLGDLETGMSVCYQVCQTDWNWCFNQNLYVQTTDPKVCQIIVHTDPNIEQIQFSTCLPGQPLVEAIVFTNLYINYAPPDPECMTPGTADACWGAIKNLFSD